MKKPSWLVLLLIGVASGAASAQDLRTLTIDDMFAIQRVGDPQMCWVSPPPRSYPTGGGLRVHETPNEGLEEDKNK